jgi:hypothetical protein
MIWYPPYSEDPDPEEAEGAAEYTHAMFEAFEEAAAKYPDYAAEATSSVRRGVTSEGPRSLPQGLSERWREREAGLHPQH